MSEPPNHERLLTEILTEDSAVAGRGALLGQMLHAARRRRRFRQARRAACALVLLAAGLWAFWPHPTPTGKRPEGPRPYALVQTHPFSKTALLQTSPLPAANLLRSLPTAVVVTTAVAAQPLQEINDKDLLALAAPNPAVLVRDRLAGSAELVFAPSAQEPTGGHEPKVLH
jgi:hypothetical protein